MIAIPSILAVWMIVGLAVGISRSREYRSPEDSIVWGLIWMAAWPALLVVDRRRANG